MGTKTIVFLKQLASMGSFPACVHKIWDIRTGEVLFEQAAEKPPWKGSDTMVFQDVPSYLKIDWARAEKGIRTRTLVTQKTYVVDLDRYGDPEAYLQEHFGPKSRSALRRHKKRLEQCFDVEYRVHYGAVDQVEFDLLFEQLRDLMERRFEQKKERNYELRHLEEIKQDVFPKLLEKQASIFVVYADKRPISIRINLMKGSLAYYLLSAYDPDYDIFRVGKLDMWMNIQWLMGNDYIKYDLLKGYAYIKERWADSTYDNTMVLAHGDNSLWGRVHFLFVHWKAKFPLFLIGLAKHFKLDDAFRAWKQKKQIREPIDILKLNLGGDKPVLLGEALEIPSSKGGLHREIIKLSHKHCYPVDQVIVHNLKDNPDQYQVQLAEHAYLLKFIKSQG